MRRTPRIPIDRGALEHVSWTGYGNTSMHIPLTRETSTMHGRCVSAKAWARLRWGDEWTDGHNETWPDLYLHVREEQGWDCIARVRSRLRVGQRVVLVGATEARAVVSGVRLARCAEGDGGWAWLVGFKQADGMAKARKETTR